MEEIEFVELTDKFGRKTGKVVPSPQRYLFVDGPEPHYYDKVAKRKISVEKVESAMKDLMNPLVIRNFEPLLSDNKFSLYLASRRKKISDFLLNPKSETITVNNDSSEAFLRDLYLMAGPKNKGLKCAFVTLDLRGFTKIGQSIPTEKLTTLATLLSREVSMLADQSGGFILKYMGDGVIAYFTAPNMLALSNNAVRYADRLRKLIMEVINPAFREVNYPILKFGIAVECGFVNITRVGSGLAKMHHDLIGSPINITFKLQTLSKESDILLGENIVKYLDSSFKNRLEPVELPPNWDHIFSESSSDPKEIEESFKARSTLIGKLKSMLNIVNKNKRFRVYRLN